MESVLSLFVKSSFKSSSLLVRTSSLSFTEMPQAPMLSTLRAHLRECHWKKRRKAAGKRKLLLTQPLSTTHLLAQTHRAMATTMMHALTTQAVDIVLAGLLLLGSVMGAQFGTQIAMKARPEVLRLVLAAIVIAVALRMLYGLGVQPDEVYTVSPL